VEDQWAAAARHVAEHGWARLKAHLTRADCADLLTCAPATWQAETDVGSVRQGGVSSGRTFDDASAAVRELGVEIHTRVNAARPAELPEVPPFTDASWSKSDRAAGHHFISAHRDPQPVGGVIAIVTLTGQARFRVWDDDGVTEWLTGEGDLVLLRGNGWPTAEARCPLHEVDPPDYGERAILTLRHNVRGAGADYFP
jgi:hypothetical protein